MTEKKKEPVLDAIVESCKITPAEEGFVVELSLSAQGRNSARGLVRCIDEPVCLTEDNAGGSSPLRREGYVKKVSVARGANDKPVKCKALVVGHGDLQRLVGMKVLVEKMQREMALEEPDQKSIAAGE